LEKCLAALERVIDGADRTADLLAEDLRHAIHQLGRITGRVAVEDYLDVIFRDFCIGK
jgi:tRNA modification GTPase